MPACFQLIDKETGQPESLQTVDEKLCEYLDVPCHPVQYHANWFDTIGYGLAIGHNWEDIKGYFPDKCHIVDWMSEHYTTSAWREQKTFRQ